MHENSAGTSRRNFLSTVARGAAAATAAPWLLSTRSAAEDEKGRWPLKLSTSSIHFIHRPIEEACERIAKLGFEAIDIWDSFQGCPHLGDVDKRLGAEGLKSLLDKHKLRLFAFSLYVAVNNAEEFSRHLELLGNAGGGVAVRGSSGPCDPRELKTKMKAFLESLKPQAELAGKNKCRIAVENHGSALLDSPDSLKAFVDMNTSPHLGIALAPYHIQAGKWSVEESIGVCGKQLFFFYAWQLAGGTAQLPGHGPADFTPWISALARAKYDGYINAFMHGDLEPDDMAKALAKSREYLKGCHAKAALK